MSSTTQNEDDAVEFGPDGRKIESWDSPWNLSKHPNSSGKFAKKHGIFAWALPFKHYEGVSPYAAAKNMADYLQSREPSRRQVSNSAIVSAGNIPTTNGYGVEEIALIHGWWRGGSRSSSGVYYCNPEYAHSFNDDELMTCGTHPSEETIRQRMQIVRKAAGLGLSSALLARPFGHTSTEAPAEWCRRNDFPYSEHRLEGIKTMARTWKTICAWGKTKREIADVFNHARSTVSERIADHAADFEPPEEPSLPNYDE